MTSLSPPPSAAEQMFLADPTEKMVFPAEDFAGKPSQGLSGAKLYSVNKERLPKLEEGGYTLFTLQWIQPDGDWPLPGRNYILRLSRVSGERPGVTWLQDDDGHRIWLTAGSGRAVAFAYTERKEWADVG